MHTLCSAAQIIHLPCPLFRQTMLLCAVDLVVDWVQDKLYWSDDRLKRIEELDIGTGIRRIVIQLEPADNPLGLALYPLENNRYRYIMGEEIISKRQMPKKLSYLHIHRSSTSLVNYTTLLIVTVTYVSLAAGLMNSVCYNRGAKNWSIGDIGLFPKHDESIW